MQTKKALSFSLQAKIKFTDIAYLNEEAMLSAHSKADFTLADVLEADRAAREFVIKNYK